MQYTVRRPADETVRRHPPGPNRLSRRDSRRGGKRARMAGNPGPEAAMQTRRGATILVLAIVATWGAAPALAEGGGGAGKPFRGSGLFYGRSVKPPVGSRRFAAGLDVAVAPMDIAYRIAGDQMRDEAINRVCEGSTDPDCPTTAATYVDTALEALAQIPDSQWDLIESAAGGDTTGLDQALAAAGVAPDDRAAIIQYVEQVPGTPDEKRSAVRVARGVATNRGVNLLMEPWAEYNSKWIGVGLGIPFTLQIRDGNTSAHMANISLDVRSGGVWGDSVAFGLTGGVTVYFPTGTSSIDQSAAADLFRAPKYMHRYLSFAPYLVLGVDLAQWWELQGHVELVTQHAVRGSPAVTSSQYIKYGFGTVLLSRLFINLIAEINGVAPIHDADGMNAVFVGGGLQFRFWVMKLAIAAQGPVYQGGGSDNLSLAGVPIGTLSRFSVMARLAFAF